MLNLVHDNPDLTNVQKIHYLQQSLAGNAAKLIWDLKLCDTAHNNKRMIIVDHLASLFPVKNAKNKSGAKPLLLEVDSVLRGLVSCELDVEVGATPVPTFFVRSDWTRKHSKNGTILSRTVQSIHPTKT